MSHQLTVKNIARAYYEAVTSQPDKIDTIAENTVRLMHKEGKMKDFSLFLKYVNDWWNADHSTIDAKVFSKNKLSTEQLEKVKEALQSRYETANVNIKNILDGNVIGGMRIELGDEVIDDTVQTRLNHLAKQIAG